MTADIPASSTFSWRRFLAVAGPGTIVVGSGLNLVSLSVGVQVMNALLLPIVLGFLFLLARRLPWPYRLSGVNAAISPATVVFGVYSGAAGLWGVTWRIPKAARPAAPDPPEITGCLLRFPSHMTRTIPSHWESFR